VPRFAPLWAPLPADGPALERWLLPGECLLCRGAAGSSDPLVCAVCRSRWRPVPAPACGRCGQPLPAGTRCRVCPGWPAAFRSARSAVWLDDAARHAVHLLKYEGWWRVAECLADAMAPAGAALPGVLVPVPLGRWRERSRGYNQSAMLARFLGRRLGRPVGAGLLRRARETTTQTRLTPEARAANVRGAFRAPGPVTGPVVLVDDVFTTGATLAEAAAALAAAGAREVAALTFARAELPLAALARDP
jgi:ComF family protein